MVRYVIPLIVYVCRNMKLMITLNLYMIPLNKILDINYKYCSLKQPMETNILWGVTIIFIFQINSESGGLLRAKGRWPEVKNTLQRKLGHIV